MKMKGATIKEIFDWNRTKWKYWTLCLVFYLVFLPALYGQQYQKTAIAGNDIILDKSFGLMWHSTGSGKYIPYLNVVGWLHDFNRKGYASYSDWRLPTEAEALSFLGVFYFKGGRDLWIGDGYNLRPWAYVKNQYVGIGKYTDTNQFGYSPMRFPGDSTVSCAVWPVRSIKR